MYKDKRISVALASYNGEKYIEEQLVSICNQTVKPDEIVISDDGSTDNTLSIIKKIASDKIAEGIDVKVVHNQIRKGVCGNFESAITNTTGDYIFLSDQDDIWLSDKVEKVMQTFFDYPEMLCVIHDATLIDGLGNDIVGTFNNRINAEKLNIEKGQVFKLESEDFLEQSVSGPLANGMVLCISKELLVKAVPFPRVSVCHDQWLLFCAICGNACVYLADSFEKYRLHGNNACGNSVYRGGLRDRLSKIMRRLKIEEENTSLDTYYLGQAMVAHLEAENMTETQAYETALRVQEVGEKLLDCKLGGDNSRFSKALQII